MHLGRILHTVRGVLYGSLSQCAGIGSFGRIGRVAAVAAIALLCSCLSPNNIRMAETNPNGWNSSVSVAYDNSDSLSLRTLYIVARFNSTFGYDHLGLVVATTTPEGYKWRDTVHLKTFDTEPHGDLFFDREQPLRIQTTLARPGRYLFTFTPLMPGETVKGVTAVGIDIR